MLRLQSLNLLSSCLLPLLAMVDVIPVNHKSVCSLWCTYHIRWRELLMSSWEVNQITGWRKTHFKKLDSKFYFNMLLHSQSLSYSFPKIPFLYFSPLHFITTNFNDGCTTSRSFKKYVANIPASATLTNKWWVLEMVGCAFSLWKQKVALKLELKLLWIYILAVYIPISSCKWYGNFGSIGAGI